MAFHSLFLISHELSPSVFFSLKMKNKPNAANQAPASKTDNVKVIMERSFEKKMREICHHI